MAAFSHSGRVTLLARPFFLESVGVRTSHATFSKIAARGVDRGIWSVFYFAAKPFGVRVCFPKQGYYYCVTLRDGSNYRVAGVRRMDMGRIVIDFFRVSSTSARSLGARKMKIDGRRAWRLRFSDDLDAMASAVKQLLSDRS